MCARILIKSFNDYLILEILNSKMTPQVDTTITKELLFLKRLSCSEALLAFENLSIIRNVVLIDGS